MQSEREEETRDRAERGSAVRGSDQASVAAKQDPLPTDQRDDLEDAALEASYRPVSSSAMREPSYILRNASTIPRE